MLKLEDIRKDSLVCGIIQNKIARVIMVEAVGGDALTVYYKDDAGKLSEQMLFRSDELRLSIAVEGKPWGFDASGKDFKLGLEAYRISEAALFDPMMAVHTSNVEPLPHQISAVYEVMLPKQPLRFVLADDPGAGKTIMAGLLVRELLMRADAKRILIVSPGSLSGQWQDELYEKFDLQFEIFSKEKHEQSTSRNFFEEHNLLICRLDQLSRSEEFQEKLRQTEWDLIIVDEAHKLSANYYGNKVNKTKRFALGELLGSISRHFLLMTATPHNGKEEDFQIWLSLLDADRFYGKFREGAHKVDVTDMMRRMVKEELLKFDGKPLFPERRAYTANYELSPAEASLYDAVTNYVRNEMNRADKLEGKRKGTVGFALTQLQRRLASSPEAIFQSLRRRKKKLEARLEEMKVAARGQQAIHGFYLAETTRPDYVYQERALDLPDDLDEAEDELSAEEYELYTEQVVDQATAAETMPELEAEITILQGFALPPSGYWQTEDKQTVIEFKPCAEALCGYLAFTGVEAGAKDEKNPDLAQRNRTLCNLPLVTGLKKDGEHYSGGAFYDPEAELKEIAAEKKSLLEFHQLAADIIRNSKGEVLLTALRRGFTAAEEAQKEKGASRLQANATFSLCEFLLDSFEYQQSKQDSQNATETKQREIA